MPLKKVFIIYILIFKDLDLEDNMNQNMDDKKLNNDLHERDLFQKNDAILELCLKCLQKNFHFKTCSECLNTHAKRNAIAHKRQKQSAKYWYSRAGR